MPIPLDCPGSLLPVSHLQPGALVVCDICGRNVYLTIPPRPGLGSNGRVSGSEAVVASGDAALPAVMGRARRFPDTAVGVAQNPRASRLLESGSHDHVACHDYLTGSCSTRAHARPANEVGWFREYVEREGCPGCVFQQKVEGCAHRVNGVAEKNAVLPSGAGHIDTSHVPGRGDERQLQPIRDTRTLNADRRRPARSTIGSVNWESVCAATRTDRATTTIPHARPPELATGGNPDRGPAPQEGQAGLLLIVSKTPTFALRAFVNRMRFKELAASSCHEGDHHRRENAAASHDQIMATLLARGNSRPAVAPNAHVATRLRAGRPPHGAPATHHASGVPRAKTYASRRM